LRVWPETADGATIAGLSADSKAFIADLQTLPAEL
jgi:hypothetical protein